MPRKLLLSLALLPLLASQPARAADPVDPLGDRIARAWSSKQDRQGRFPDYVKDRLGSKGRDTYSESMMGAALIRWGLQRNNRRWIESGSRALLWAFRHPSPRGSVGRVFEDMSLADSYRYAFPRLKHRRWRGLISSWKNRLAASYIDKNINRRTRAENQKFIQSLGVFILASSNLKSSKTHSVLKDKKLAATLSLNYIKYYSQQYQNQTGSQLIGDSPGFPLAYHLLTQAAVQRMLDYGYKRKLSAFQPLLEQARKSTRLFVAPDGRLAYSGRSDDQAWTLALGIYLSRKPGGPVAGPIIERLSRLYFSKKWGIWLVPSMQQSLTQAMPLLDHYAASVPYSGLTLLFLSWAKENKPSNPAAIQSNLQQIIGARGVPMAQITLQKKDDIWFALRGGNTPESDGRQSPGVLSLQLQTAQGWKEVLSGRTGSVALDYKQGPFLITPDKNLLAPYLVSPKLSSQGEIALTGYYRVPGQAQNLFRMRQYFVPRGCALEVRVEKIDGHQIQLQLPLWGRLTWRAGNSLVWGRARMDVLQGSIQSVRPGPATAVSLSNSLIRMLSLPGEDLVLRIGTPSCTPSSG